MITRETLRSQARDVVLEQILHGELLPGETLNLSELAAELGISRTPLREALLSLAEQGLVGIGERNRGFYVWPLTLEEAEDLGQINQALESLAVRTTGRAGEEQIQNMRMINQRLTEVHGHPREMMEWDDRWHESLVRGSENDELEPMIKQVRNRFYRYRWYGYDYVVLHGLDAKRQSIDQHAEITDALEAGDLERAGDLVEEHWEIGLDLLSSWLPRSEKFPDGDVRQEQNRPGGSV